MQDKRINAVDALQHPYLEEGRLRYHSCMCKCCTGDPNSHRRRFSPDLEPKCPTPFGYSFEDELVSLSRIRREFANSQLNPVAPVLLGCILLCFVLQTRCSA